MRCGERPCRGAEAASGAARTSAAVRAVRGETLQQSLHHVAGKELMENFRVMVYDMASPAPWEPERFHSGEHLYLRPHAPRGKETDVDLVDGDDVTDSSVAELAERTLRERELLGGLVSVEESTYGGALPIDILKVEHAWVALRSWCKTRISRTGCAARCVKCRHTVRTRGNRQRTRADVSRQSHDLRPDEPQLQRQKSTATRLAGSTITLTTSTVERGLIWRCWTNVEESTSARRRWRGELTPARRIQPRSLSTSD